MIEAFPEPLEVVISSAVRNLLPAGVGTQQIPPFGRNDKILEPKTES